MNGFTKTEEIVFGVTMLAIGLFLEWAIDVWRERRTGRKQG